MKKIILITLAGFYMLATFGQIASINWTKTYPNSYCFFDVKSTFDSGYILAGHNRNSGFLNEILYKFPTANNKVIKTDANGNIQWSDSTQTEDFGGFTAVTQLSDSSYIVVGSGGVNYWLAMRVTMTRYRKDGLLIWQKSFGSSIDWWNGQYSVSLLYDVLETTDREILVTGYTNGQNQDVVGNHGGFDGWILKLDTSGKLLWQKCIGTHADEYLRSAVQTSDKGFLLAGGAYADTIQNSNMNGWLVKTDSAGNVLWEKKYGDSTYNEFEKLMLDKTDSSVLLTGYTGVSSSTLEFDVNNESDLWVEKTDINGETIWAKRYGSSGTDVGFSILSTHNHGCIVAGVAGANDGNVQGNSGGIDEWVLCLSNSGDIVWQKCIGDANNNFGMSIAYSSNERIALAGIYTNYNSDDYFHFYGSTEGSLSTINFCNQCNMPTGVAVNSITSTSAKIKWNAVSCAIGYQTQYRKKGTTVWTTKQQIGTSKILSGLMPSTTYQWRVLTGCQLAPQIASAYITGPEFKTLPAFAISEKNNSTIKTLSNLQATLFPNPTKNIAFISVSNVSGKVQIILSDIRGKFLWQSSKISSTSISIPTQNLAQGTYMVLVKDEKESRVVKMVKE